VSLFDYVKVLNAGLDAAGKRALMEMLWEVAYADGRIDKYEEHLLRKLADLLYIPERDYIGAAQRRRARTQGPHRLSRPVLWQRLRQPAAGATCRSRSRRTGSVPRRSSDGAQASVE